MSTHGCVAWKVSTFTIGVYNHADSYPVNLGRRVWLQLRELGAEGLIARLKQYGDWEEFENCGVCKYCGKVVGQPFNIRIEDPNGKDPDCLYHEHGNSREDQLQPFKHGNVIDWVYVINPDFNALEIWFSVPESQLSRYTSTGMMDSGFVDSYGFTHVFLTSVDLRDDEPNWVFLEHEVSLLKRGTEDGF